MKTTLKRGFGRGAAFDGNGRSIFPPGVQTPMTRYRQPDPERRGPWSLIRTVVLWTILVALVVAGGAAGAAYLRAHRFVAAVAPKTKQDKATAKRLDVAVPGQPTTALVIGTDKRKGKEAEVTGRSDTLMLVRADPETNSISLMSFPRDLLTTIKCPGQADHVDRINAAFSECGSLGSLLTVKGLTGIPINYFITVNFRGFLQLVNNLGGVWVDVDHRYYCSESNCPGVAAINLQPGYQRLRAYDALAFVRYRHFDSDLFRVARQQLFLKALKQQISASLDLNTVLDIVDAVEKNVTIGRGGNKPLDLKTLKDYIYFARGLPPGHIFQSRIDDLTGYAELTAPTSSIQAAVHRFVQPDVRAPEKARDVTLGIKRRTHALRPSSVTVTVLNGNGVTGSAGNAAYALSQRGYKIVLPPTQKPANAPSFDYFRSAVYYDRTKPAGRTAARQLANLFGDADVKPVTPLIAALSNGALVTVVVGQTFHGSIAPAPTDETPKRQPANVVVNPTMTLSALRSVRRKLSFPLEVPHVVERSSRLEPDAPVRRYWINNHHRAVRLTFASGENEYWGIEETDWSDAPTLASPSFTHRLRGRIFDFYYAGPHLHMVVLRENGATYWVVNTILDSLSNETMLAIARGLRPLGGK
jgi:LCP family protein required for cell wall assembly